MLRANGSFNDARRVSSAGSRSPGSAATLIGSNTCFHAPADTSDPAKGCQECGRDMLLAGRSRVLDSMDLGSVRRASSAGNRLITERSIVSRSTGSQPAAGDTVSTPPQDAADTRDPVKQDRVWRDSIWSERRGVQEWEKNWGFLKNYDQMGRLKPEEPSPAHTSVFSDHVPNTSNQMYGSSLSTPLGKDLMRRDWLCGSHHRRRQDPC